MGRAGRAGIAVTLLTAGLLIGVATVQAQDGGVPPLPVIYGGEVYVGGVLLAGEAELTVRVGDWEGRPVLVQDGRFAALIAGPPSETYVGQSVTFHLNGLEAAQRFLFLLRGTPISETVRLEFGLAAEPTAPPPAEPAPTSKLEPTPTQGHSTVQTIPQPEVNTDETKGSLSIPWATLAVLLAGGAVLLVVLNLAFRKSLRGHD